MRTVFLASLLTLTLFLRPSLADDDSRNIAGYGNTVWGMTEDEVLKAEAPRAEKLDKPDKILPAGDIQSIVINNIDVGVRKFRALFTFDAKDRKLKQVTLESVEELNPAGTFAYLEKLLTEKYGSPTYKEQGKSASWKLPNTIIQTTYFNFPLLQKKDSPFFKAVVIYRPAASSADASKNL
jgi:hypothetical protein